MRLSAVALDYDGTVAQNDRLDPDVRAAIGQLRARGVVVALVTGRIISDLRRVAGDLHFVDAVVGENGGVLEFPDSGYSASLAPPLPQPLIDALSSSGVHFERGQTMAGTDANEAPRILDLIRRLELPLVIAFNRGRLMVLPQAVSKATGLRQALTILRLSARNTLGIGDAENDHELLQLCEVGVAVRWGSAALKAAADYVLPGDGPPAVGAYLRWLAETRKLPAVGKPRRRLLLGYTDEGDPMALAVKGRNVLVAGDTKSGKSWVTGLLCEQLIMQGYSLCVLDPEGDYVSLDALPGVMVLGGADPLPRPRELMRTLRHPDVSAVIDLSRVSHAGKLDYMRNVLPALALLRRETGLPHRVILDEAHYFLNDENGRALVDLEMNGYTLVTYRASRLNPALLASARAVVVTRQSDPEEVQALAALCTNCGDSEDIERWPRRFAELRLSEAVVLPMAEEAGGRARRIRLAPRLTPHFRHAAKYIDVPVSPHKAFAFVVDGRPVQRARTLREFVEILDSVPAASLATHFQRHDFSRWLQDVFGDYPLASTVREIEDRRGLGNDDGVAALTQAVRARYDFVDPFHP